MKAFTQELKLAANSLSRLPGFSITVIFTLAITLAALVTVANLNHLLLKPLPYPDAAQLHVMGQIATSKNGTVRHGQNIGALIQIYQNSSYIEKMAIIETGSGILISHPQQPRLTSLQVTPEFFPLLGARTHLGRYFSKEEGLDSNQPVVVISHAAWQRWFNSDPDITGSFADFAIGSFKIIGVLTPDFSSPQLFGNSQIDIWFGIDYMNVGKDNWGAHNNYHTAITKLSADANLLQLDQQLSSFINPLYQSHEQSEKETTLGSKLVPLKYKLVNDDQAPLLLLLAGVTALISIALINVANLFLSRAIEKQRTLAIQAALGAQSKHIFKSLFAESSLLISTALLLGLVLASWINIWLETPISNSFSRMSTLELTAEIILMSVAFAISLSILLAWIAAKQVNYNKLQSYLQASGKGTSGQVSSKLRNILVALQGSLTCLLLLGSAAVLTPTLKALSKPLGYNHHNIYSLSIATGGRWDEQAQIAQMIKPELDKLAEVEEVAYQLLPIMQSNWTGILNDAKQDALGDFKFSMVPPNFFSLHQLPLIKGRTFSPTSQMIRDEENTPNEILLSASLANTLYPDGDAIGKTHYWEEKPLTVIGIVQDYYSPFDTSAKNVERLYVPYYPIFTGFAIKTKGELSKEKVIEVIKAVDPTLVVAGFNSLEERYQRGISRFKLIASLTLALITLALFLAAAGIYGVLNYSVQMRRFELGIRLALGAKTHTVINMVLKQSFAPIGLGILFSIGLATLAYSIAHQYFPESIEFNIQSIMIALPIMLIVALIACYLPVKKLIKADPVKALRCE